jgi:hypothetical protein
VGRADANSRGAVNRFGDTPTASADASLDQTAASCGRSPMKLVKRSTTTLGRFAAMVADRWRDAFGYVALKTGDAKLDSAAPATDRSRARGGSSEVRGLAIGGDSFGPRHPIRAVSGRPALAAFGPLPDPPAMPARRPRCRGREDGGSTITAILPSAAPSHC